jgi:hypothetical protein
VSNTIPARGRTATDRIEIGPMHDSAVIAPRCRAADPRSATPWRSPRCGRAATHHLAAHHIGEHRPESLPFLALYFVERDVTGLPFDACAIPVREERLLGTAGFAPARAVAHGRVTGRHPPPICCRKRRVTALHVGDSMRSVRIAFRPSRPPGRPPTQQRFAQAPGYYLRSLYSNR